MTPQLSSALVDSESVKEALQPVLRVERWCFTDHLNPTLQNLLYLCLPGYSSSLSFSSSPVPQPLQQRRTLTPFSVVKAWQDRIPNPPMTFPFAAPLTQSLQIIDVMDLVTCAVSFSRDGRRGNSKI